MAHEKSRKTTLRFRPADDDALEAVALALGTTRATAVRFLVHEKARELGLALPASIEPPKPARKVTARARR